MHFNSRRSWSDILVIWHQNLQNIFSHCQDCLGSKDRPGHIPGCIESKVFKEFHFPRKTPLLVSNFHFLSVSLQIRSIFSQFSLKFSPYFWQISSKLSLFFQPSFIFSCYCLRFSIHSVSHKSWDYSSKTSLNNTKT